MERRTSSRISSRRRSCLRSSRRPNEILAQRRRPRYRERQRCQQAIRSCHREGAKENPVTPVISDQWNENNDRSDRRSDQRNSDFLAARCEWPQTRPCPASRCRTMFSTTTIASSMTSPTAAARPPSVIRLKVCPSIFSAMNVTRTVTGIPDPPPATFPSHAGKRPDDRRQNQRQQNGIAHALDRLADDVRLIVERLNLARPAAASSDALDFIVNFLRHLHRVAVGLAVDVQQHSGLAVCGDHRYTGFTLGATVETSPIRTGIPACVFLITDSPISSGVLTWPFTRPR